MIFGISRLGFNTAYFTLKMPPILLQLHTYHNLYPNLYFTVNLTYTLDYTLTNSLI